MTRIAHKTRFDDVGEETLDGGVDYAYHGFNYVVEIAGRTFNVRTYDDEPGVAIVITADARTGPEARELVAFVLQELSVDELRFYCGAVGNFRAVLSQTLEFLP
jgi:hypothetical protein